MTADHIIMLILLVYIGFLHYLLHRKNSIIESLIQKQTNLEKLISKEGLEELISKIKGVPSDIPARQSKIFEPKIQEFILDDVENQNLYIHYTKDEEVAKKIIEEGFRFVDSFYKTAETITKDKLDLIYKHYLHKHFGTFVIILGISKDVYNRYLKEINKSNKVLNVEQIISEKSSNLDENLDELYLLPKQYVKGYINSKNGEVFANPNYNPSFDSPQFMDNLKMF